MNLDFFGFGASADLSTPLGIQVKAATDSFLVSPDWAKYGSIIAVMHVLSSVSL